MERLLIVRLSAMGDVIHTLPAVHALRQAFPQAYIGWLIEERWAELLSAPGSPRRDPRSTLRPLVDEVHTVKLKSWGKSLFSVPTLQRIATLRNDVRDAGYDVAVDLQGAIRSALLARWSGASVVYGTAEARESPASLWYTRKVIASGRHVVEQNVSVAAALVEGGRKLFPAQIADDIPHDPQAEERINQRLTEHGIAEFAILNPGAGWGAKMWPAERYGQVAKELAKDGLLSLINCGPREEELAAAVEASSAGTARRIGCSISELIALTRRARLFIGGDTGPMHLAAALKIPVVAIFGPTNPARNGPFGTRAIVLRSAISQTDHTRHREPEQGLLEITVDEVLSSARKLLRDGKAEPRAAGQVLREKGVAEKK